ncbi:MAG: hypothetical protein VX640_03030 [Pseudomonadota bacterium]|nr:hypothetical protein [Pseudomonadota bacterium]
MKAFAIERRQIAGIVAALAADELSWRFKRHVDFLTLASWTEETPLGAGGLALNAKERAACAARAERYFGMASDALDADSAAVVDDWAGRVEAALDSSFLEMSFTAAGRDSLAEACRHPADEVFCDAAAAANLLYGRRRLISLIAPHSLMGFVVTVLTPNLQRISSVDARSMAPEALAASLAFGDVVVATPTLWRYVIGEGVKAPDNAMGVCFGEEMTAELAAEMRKAGFGAVRELYGSTETGLIAWRDSPGEPFILFDHWRREGTALARRSPSGGERILTPMDSLLWENDRTFRLGGRRDGAVQVGAVNVFPDRIAQTLRAHPLVEDCRIGVSRQPGGVNRLIAHIKLNPEAAPSEQTARAIDGWCRAELRPQERPRIYSFEESLDTDGEPVRA